MQFYINLCFLKITRVFSIMIKCALFHPSPILFYFVLLLVLLCTIAWFDQWNNTIHSCLWRFFRIIILFHAYAIEHDPNQSFHSYLLIDQWSPLIASEFVFRINETTLYICIFICLKRKRKNKTQEFLYIIETIWFWFFGIYIYIF